MDPRSSAPVLQRKECAECRTTKNRSLSEATSVMRTRFLRPDILSVQLKLTIGATNDPLEHEADRVADQVLAAPAHSGVSGVAPRIQGYKGQMTGEAGTVPASVDRVLASPGRPLDPALQREMEQRFGHDFSRVQVHSDAAAQQSAREVNASAYTLGNNIVFGARRFTPETHEGRRLIAHELTHVVQQSGVRDSAADRCTADRFSPPGRPLIAGVIARQRVQPQPATLGWSDAPAKSPNSTDTTVDENGSIQTGKAATKGVWRVPVQDLRHGLQDSDKAPVHESSKGRAVALIPNTVKSAAPDKDKNVSVDVLLHLHGFGVGYRQLKPDKHDFGKVLQEGQLRDVDLYQMEQQLLSHVADSKHLVIAVLPQGSERSNFGDIGANSDAYLKEVFAKLIPTYLPENAIPGHLIVSGHSGGGVPAMAVANQRTKAGKQTDVLLFDAINFACSEKEEVVGKDGKTTTQCKKDSPCASNEYGTARDWVTDRIRAEVKGLNQATEDLKAAELQTSGTRFRGITSASLKTTSTCSYGHWYNKLKNDIEMTIKTLKVSAAVGNQLRQNYQVLEAKGLESFTGVERHERMIGAKNLEDALKH